MPPLLPKNVPAPLAQIPALPLQRGGTGIQTDSVLDSYEEQEF